MRPPCKSNGVLCPRFTPGCRKDCDEYREWNKRHHPDDFWETLGYASERDAYLDWRRSLEREYQKRKVPTGAATADEEKKKISSQQF